MIPLLIVIALFLFGFLIILAFSQPGTVLIGAIIASILLPAEIAVRVGPLPRIGPTRLIVAGFLVGISLRAIITRRRQVVRHQLPLIGYVGFYCGALMISTALSIDTAKSLFTACNQIVFFVLFYVIVSQLRQPWFWPRLRNALLFTTALLCLFSFYEEVTRVNPFRSLYQGAEPAFRDTLLRVQATFFHPIAFGSYLVLVLPFVFVGLIQSRKQHGNGTLVPLLAAFLGALFLTESRGPWLAAFIEVTIFLVWWACFNWRKSAAVLAATAIVTSIVLVMYRSDSTFQRHIDPIVNPNHLASVHLSSDEKSSEYYRVALASAVVNRLSGARWIYGFGPGTFYVADVESKYAGVEHVLTAADSQPLKLLLESGLLGIASFVLLIWAAVRNCVETVRMTKGPDQVLAVGCLASVVGFLAANITASMFGFWPMELLFWTAVAVAFSLRPRTSTLCNRGTARDRAMR